MLCFSIQLGLAQNQLPTVSFEAPLSGEDFQAPANIYVRVNATDEDGSIKNVRLELDGTLVRTEKVAPYEWGNSPGSDPELENLEVGTYTLRAIATDNNNGRSESFVTFTVSDDPLPGEPIVLFEAPSPDSSYFAPADLYVRVDATDDNAIQEVLLFIDERLVRSEATPPYEWATNNQPDADLRNLASGTYVLKAIASDFDGNSRRVTTTVQVGGPDGMGPDIGFNRPMDGDEIMLGNPLEVTVAASSDNVIENVRLYLNDTLVRTEVNPPYEWGMSDQSDDMLRNIGLGNYTLRAVAVDEIGNTSVETISVRVVQNSSGGGGGNDMNPVVSFAMPTNGQTFVAPADIEVTVNASDPDGTIQGVGLFLDGVAVRNELSAPYEWGKPNQSDEALKGLTAGTYTLRADARDNDGNESSSTIQFTVVEDDDPANVPPTVSFTSPMNEDTFLEPADLSVGVDASDADGTVTEVSLFLNGTLVSSDDTAPYSWNDAALQNLSAGNYTLRAVATDDDDAIGEATIMVTVENEIINPTTEWQLNNDDDIYYDAGKVGIGTDSPTEMLTVAGQVEARGVVVHIDAGADFVFEEGYELPDLKALEAYLAKHKHLPEVPSAQQMETEGLELSVFNIKLLQKIEELTLYTIELNKSVELLQQQNEQLQKELEAMKQERQ